MLATGGRSPKKVWQTTLTASEIAAVTNIKEAYALSLFTGAVDVDTALPELLSKLEGAGMQKIVDEANRQLQEFLSK